MKPTNDIVSMRISKAAQRAITLVTCLICALAMQAAIAGCPPGYASKGQMCVPAPPHPYHPGRALTAHSNVSSSVPLTQPAHKPNEIKKEVDWHTMKPQPGVPIEQHSSASEKHGIIFVGGRAQTASDKASLNPQPIPPGHSSLNPQPIPPDRGDKRAINSQPVPPGHAELNPQPIPPGRSLHKTPHPVAPIETNGH